MSQDDTPATEGQMKVGVRVRCIYSYADRKGKTGKVIRVDGGNAAPYTIEWDDGDTNYPHWGEASSFTILPDEGDEVPSSPPPVVARCVPPPPGEPPFDFERYNRGLKQLGWKK